MHGFLPHSFYQKSHFFLIFFGGEESGFCKHPPVLYFSYFRFIKSFCLSMEFYFWASFQVFWEKESRFLGTDWLRF